jgi:hypothetical protein
MRRRLLMVISMGFALSLASSAFAYIVVGGNPPPPPDVRSIQPR